MEKAAASVVRRVIPPVVRYLTQQARRAFNYFSSSAAPASYSGGNISTRVVAPTVPPVPVKAKVPAQHVSSEMPASAASKTPNVVSKPDQALLREIDPVEKQS